jgi:APA family basic amino acid/polyamine antiporter
VQAFLACVVTCWLEHFEALMEGFVFTIWIFYGLAAVTIIVLRIRRPDADRPYRCWGYPVVPIAFIAAAAFMTVLSILDSPGDTLIWSAILLAGVPAYYLWRHFRPAEPG